MLPGGSRTAEPRQRRCGSRSTATRATPRPTTPPGARLRSLTMSTAALRHPDAVDGARLPHPAPPGRHRRSPSPNPRSPSLARPRWTTGSRWWSSTRVRSSTANAPAMHAGRLRHPHGPRRPRPRGRLARPGARVETRTPRSGSCSPSTPPARLQRSTDGCRRDGLRRRPPRCCGPEALETVSTASPAPPSPSTPMAPGCSPWSPARRRTPGSH